MCGRYARSSDKQRIAEAFAIGEVCGLTLETAPSFNVAPAAMQPVITADPDTSERHIRIMRWGLIPPWTKTLKDFKLSTINAKAEDIETKTLWKRPFEQRRCLVPADAFYEWKKVDGKTKQPYAFAMKGGGLFAFAGIWSRWKAEDSSLACDSYSIITTEANELMAEVHVRMPVILKPQDYNRWLTPQSRPPVDLLRPYDADQMKAWLVNPAVGNVRNNGPNLCEPSGEISEQGSLW
jgi:putative SOS response-associated peptidase YedK